MRVFTRQQTAFWLRWIAANALSEMLGLGLTFAVIGLGFARLEAIPGLWGVLGSFALAVASGAIEATLVGLAQAWALRPAFPAVTRLRWWRATLIGALAAYVLGYLPSTLMSLGEQSTQSAAVEPPQAVILLLAAGMGAAAGALLSAAQWRVLRRSVTGAGVWIPANMLAWALGMPLIFWGMDIFFKFQPLARGVPFLAALLLAMGALVGAVHGFFLARLIKPADVR
jgi:hypothetical protein